MVSPAMGAAMMDTMYFLRANCVQHGGCTIGGGLISAFLLIYRALAPARIRVSDPLSVGMYINSATG